MDSRDGPGHLPDDVIRARGRLLPGAAGGASAWAGAGAHAERGGDAGAVRPVGALRERARLLSIRGSTAAWGVPAAAGSLAGEPADPARTRHDRGGGARGGRAPGGR